MFPLPIRLVMRVRSVAPMVQRMMSWMMSWMMHGEDKKVTPGKSLEDINKVRGARPENERLARSGGFHVLCIGRGFAVGGLRVAFLGLFLGCSKGPCVSGGGDGGREAEERFERSVSGGKLLRCGFLHLATGTAVVRGLDGLPIVAMSSRKPREEASWQSRRRPGTAAVRRFRCYLTIGNL